MAITSITIENFKGIGDAVTIPIRPITLLFGKNSSGKSTVLQALHYMREVCEHAGVDPDRTHMGGDYIDWEVFVLWCIFRSWIGKSGSALKLT